MFSPTCEVLLKIIEEGIGSIKGDADSTYEIITTFEFIFVLHLVKEIMEITDILCQALQRQSQDVCNALKLVASTKKLFQKMKDERRDGLLSLLLSHFVRIARLISLIYLLPTLGEGLELVRSIAIIHLNIITEWISFTKPLIVN